MALTAAQQLNLLSFTIAAKSSGELQHHGILGQKWGVRRPRGPDGLVDSDHTSAQALRRRDPKKMTTAELQAYTKRMGLEQRYSEIDKKDVSKGMKIAKKILGTVGSQTAQEFITSRFKDKEFDWAKVIAGSIGSWIRDWAK